MKLSVKKKTAPLPAKKKDAAKPADAAPEIMTDLVKTTNKAYYAALEAEKAKVEKPLMPWNSPPKEQELPLALQSFLVTIVFDSKQSSRGYTYGDPNLIDELPDDLLEVSDDIATYDERGFRPVRPTPKGEALGWKFQAAFQAEADKARAAIVTAYNEEDQETADVMGGILTDRLAQRPAETINRLTAQKPSVAIMHPTGQTETIPVNISEAETRVAHMPNTAKGYVISYDIPAPRGRRTPTSQYPFEDVLVGGSFFVPAENGEESTNTVRRVQSAISNAHKKYKAEGKRFTVREDVAETLEGKVRPGARVWRVA